ncbi:MAG TPA: bifunctional 2-polyprenyl-6-hydroxyphenol methylase/3-demethylubiquinol 3-O-methyltransferase UbiG [Kofleriaceae bacterium]|nr:bifunctional 2-polyprenyl-6-hydroxyphenol methylase/3-demethylubiquinol 3-O-methyltransferase UbiG [Kofleriaceae bacterium]
MTLWILIVPIALQAIAMLVDEGYFHRRRGLPRWERIGHPLDTLTIVACLAWLVTHEPSRDALAVYVALAIGSTLFVTKDEPVHAKLCGGGEQWLHAVLFALHPIVLAALAIAWWQGETGLLVGQLAVTLAFCGYQITYWSFVRDDGPRAVNNAWYGPLGARWYEADDTPIALLRAESRHRNPWIADEIARRLGAGPKRVLDLGCGAGFLANDLAARGHRVTGIDTTPDNLLVARERDRTGTVDYQVGDACALALPDASFDVVCAMDLIEHVEQPERLVAEAARVLAPGGLLFFHTFNRTWQANLIVIKGVERFVRNTPKDLHVLRLFVRPDELAAIARRHGLEIAVLQGSRPRFRWPLWRMVLTGRVGDDFAFTFTRSTKLGYTGYMCKPAIRAAAPRLDVWSPREAVLAHEDRARVVLDHRSRAREDRAVDRRP